MSSTRISAAAWDQDQKVLKDIRRKVFIEEQQVPEVLEWDEHDTSAYHCLAWLDDQAVAVGRLQLDGQLGRMAVLKEYRHRGIGLKLLQHLIDYHHDHFEKPLFLHAQHHAVSFYEKAGFEAHGDQFFEAGIAHFLMRRQTD